MGSTARPHASGQPRVAFLGIGLMGAPQARKRPAIIGWASQVTGKTELSILFLSACLLLASALIFIIPARLVKR